jgi:hypothetical protein
VKAALRGSLGLMLLACLGCDNIYTIRLAPPSPKAPKVGQLRNVVVAPFSDERRASGADFAHSPCGDSFVGSDLNERLVYSLSVCLEDSSTPSRILAQSVAQLMKEAGFTVLLADHPLYSGDVVVKGRILRFFAVNERQSPGDQKPRRLVTNVDYELSFSRDGKTLAAQRFSSEVSGNPYEQNLTLTYTWNKYFEEALEDLMSKTAAYLQSEPFQEAVLGIGPGKAAP